MPLIQVDVIIPEPPVLVGSISDENTVLAEGIYKIPGLQMFFNEIEQSKAAPKYKEERGDDRCREPSGDPHSELCEDDQKTEETEN